MTKENFAKWLKAAGVRAIKTVAQTAVATIGTAAVLGDVNWVMVGSAAVLAGGGTCFLWANHFDGGAGQACRQEIRKSRGKEKRRRPLPCRQIIIRTPGAATMPPEPSANTSSARWRPECTSWAFPTIRRTRLRMAINPVSA